MMRAADGLEVEDAGEARRGCCLIQAPQAASSAGSAAAWMVQRSNMPSPVARPVACRHHLGSPSTSATSLDTCAAFEQRHPEMPGGVVGVVVLGRGEDAAAGAEPAEVHDRLGEHRDSCGGAVPCGPAARPWLSATCNLSNTQRWAGFHSHASGSSVGMRGPAGRRRGSKYWWRQGAGSMIGTFHRIRYSRIGLGRRHGSGYSSR